ncbi:ubiquinone/menaquinone biosynthesis methyltransferase [Candidatus Eisenbacteria bacterium]|uniref:Ubiquinone/menaquinone biosynthesis methyltransferase n=1 Tax=Eiseniibacteriota bacterium TaxID=2212470 RepID=A0ABV6YPE3_UNCEI
MASSIERIFSEVPATYELVNHILTLGMDIRWRRKAAETAAAGAEPGEWVDMCTGTGEMAVYLKRLVPEGTRVMGVDMSRAMLAEARGKPEAKGIDLVRAAITDLPFPDESIDLITMSFATRNVNLNREALVRAFAELHRVLRPGGLFVNLETSQPPSAFIRKCFHLFVSLLVRPVGSLISGSSVAYAYLSRTIPRFYGPEDLAGIMREAGFGEVCFRRLFLGAAAVHQARKAGPDPRV